MPRHATSLGAGNFPAASKLMQRYEQEKAYKMHQQKVKYWGFNMNNWIEFLRSLKGFDNGQCPKYILFFPKLLNYDETM